MADQSRIKEIIVHYTATYEDDTSITTAVIDGWHKARGWAGIGYHFVIYQDGSLHTGRPLHVVGAHAPPNTGRVGICYVGGLKRASGPNKGFDTRTPAQVETMKTLIGELLSGRRNTNKVTVDPQAPVIGHRDTPGASTQCPGFDATAWWKRVSGLPAPASRPAAASAPVRSKDVHEDPPKSFWDAVRAFFTRIFGD